MENIDTSSLLKEMLALGERLRTQDNRCTDGPVFLIQIPRSYECDPVEATEVHWFDQDHEQEDEEERKRLESEYQRFLLIPKGYTRRGLNFYWETVTACLSQQGCDDHIALNGHNLRGHRVYVVGSHRNDEWKTVRAFLMALPADFNATEGRVLTCVYCGHEYPQGTPAHGAEVLTEHIKVCAQHPLQAARVQIASLRTALANLVGASTEEELKGMEFVIRSTKAPAADKTAALDAIHALLATMPEPERSEDLSRQAN